MDNIKNFKDLNIKPTFSLEGEKVSITALYGKPIIIKDYVQIYANDTTTGNLVPCLQIQFINHETDVNHVVFTRSKVLRRQLESVDPSLFPFKGTLINSKQGTFLQ